MFDHYKFERHFMGLTDYLTFKYFNKLIMHNTNFKLSLLLLIFFIANFNSDAQTYAKNGMVVSSSTIASEVGVNILQIGGNAIDASIATAFALAVTHPSAGNIGGGGFMVYLDSTGNATTIDFREKAPINAHSNMFLDENGKLPLGINLYGKESSINHVGLKSVGVPGTVAGLYKAHQKYGSLPWNELVQPAIDLAANGFPLTYSLHTTGIYFKENSQIPFLQNYFDNVNGEVTAFGEIWKQPELARTLISIRDNGHDGFYSGFVAEEIEKYMLENGGIITKEDLAKYQAVEREPIQGNFKDYTIYSMPPPSSGGTALVEMMNMMEMANLNSLEFNSSEYVHVVAEVMRRAFADRAMYMGDSDFSDIPTDLLTSKAHAKKRFESIDIHKASKSDSSKFGQIYEGSNTTHFSVIDKHGNAVSLTYTLEHSYGSGMGSPKLGFIFNNEMGDFNPIPNITTNTGLIGTAPNLIEPEKRMLSSMTPTIVAKDGKPYLIVGSPGGRTIINTVFQTVLNVLGYGMQIDEAIEAIKIHHQWLPDQIYYEKDKLSPDTKDKLMLMGHKMVERRSLGELMGIQIDIENKVLVGKADSSSREGGAVGY